MHADIWRQRLDATTNWAVVSVAAIVTFSFSQAHHPHFVLLLGFVFGGFFLTMESRRYQTFDLWRHRVRLLNRFAIGPALDPKGETDPEVCQRELAALARELGSTRPHLSFVDAIGYRLRRNYGFLFLAVLGTWLLKLWYHPIETTHFDEMVARAAVGVVGGKIVMATVFVTVILGLFAAARARSEHMHEWSELPSPLRRLLLQSHRTTREMSLSSDIGLRSMDRSPIRDMKDLLERMRDRGAAIDAGLAEKQRTKEEADKKPT